MNATDFLLPSVGLSLTALGAMHLKVKGSSVLVHFGSHGMGFNDKRATRMAAEVVSILTLNIGVDAYWAEHGLHHGLATFGRAGQDPDATLLDSLGFKPGMSELELWRHLTRVLVSPRFHARLSRSRLFGVFLAGPVGRIVFAWSFWTALAAGFAASGQLMSLLLGFVLPLLVFGNIGALLELASEHRFNIALDTVGRERQASLSHARLLGAPPPEGKQAQQPLEWLSWIAATTGAIAVRIGVWPGDLSHHDGHHVGLRGALTLTRYGWMNAAYEYSASLWAPAAIGRRYVGSLREGLNVWFQALASEACTAV